MDSSEMPRYPVAVLRRDNELRHSFRDLQNLQLLDL